MNQRLLPKDQPDHHFSDHQTSIPYKSLDIEGQCCLQKIQPIKSNFRKHLIFIVASVCTFGILLLPCYWYTSLRRWLYYDFCEIEQATHFYITNNDGTQSIQKKQTGRMTTNQTDYIETTFFVNRYLKYFYHQKQNEGFFSTTSYDYISKLTSIYNPEAVKEFRGLQDREVDLLRESFGVGTMILPTPACYILFLQQIVQPFFIFVVYSVLVWCYEEYYYYASIIAITSITSISINLWDLMSLNDKIFNMAFYEVEVNVLRGNQVKAVSSRELVPGDIVFLRQQIKLPFDGVLLTGTLLMNQCALTGESVPIVKKSLNKTEFMTTKTVDKNCCLYEGTEIIQICSQTTLSNTNSSRFLKHGLMVCVTKTNFITLKGQLVRIITFPKSREMRFYRESAKFLGFLFCLSIVSYIVLALRLKDHIPYGQLFVKFLDLVTVTVPPGLPASMSIGIAYSIKRLKSSGIFCISPDKIMVGGRLNHICFDKTGTLTELEMDFYEFVPCVKSEFVEALNVESQKMDKEELMKTDEYQHSLINMGTCHTIIRLDESQKLVGDPMQVKVFSFSQFDLLSRKQSQREHRESNQSLAEQEYNSIKFHSKAMDLQGQIIRKFQFDSELQRMSVVVRSTINKDFAHIYCKGSPESLEKIMIPTTVPKNYFQTLKKYASCGFRVLALGYKQIEPESIQTIDRLNAQNFLLFSGFEVFENKLKPETEPTIRILREDAGMEMVIITGDNPLTASNIGFKSGIVQLEANIMICESMSSGMISVYNFYELYSPKKSTSRYLEGLTEIELDVINPSKTKQTLDFQCKISQLALRICQIGSKGSTKFCMTGQVFQKLLAQESSTNHQRLDFIEHVRVFARSKPNDKTLIISHFQSKGKIVGMCGDGANDCGALKQADVGLSLSNSEASIAAPFTSKISNISSMINLVKQCRGGLATNFSLFNIMALYSLIQYTSTILIQYFYAYPSDFQFLYWDLACNFMFFLTIGNTETSQKISKQRPSDSLFRLSNIIFVLSMFFIQLLGQISIVILMRNPPFSNYINYWDVGGEENNLMAFQQLQTLTKVSIQGTTVFLASNFMYLFSVLAFCVSAPWKKQFYTNKLFLTVYVLVFVYSAGICVVDRLRLGALEIVDLDLRFEAMILLVGVWVGFKMYLNQKYILEKGLKKLQERYPSLQWM